MVNIDLLHKLPNKFIHGLSSLYDVHVFIIQIRKLRHNDMIRSLQLDIKIKYLVLDALLLNKTQDGHRLNVFCYDKSFQSKLTWDHATTQTNYKIYRVLSIFNYTSAIARWISNRDIKTVITYIFVKYNEVIFYPMILCLF